MAKQSLRLSVDGELLRKLIGSKGTWSDLADKYGVTKQAVSGWLSDGLMPPRALVEIARELDLSPEQIEEVLAPQAKKAKARKQWKVTVLIDEPETDDT